MTAPTTTRGRGRPRKTAAQNESYKKALFDVKKELENGMWSSSGETERTRFREILRKLGGEYIG